jgi:hypothetical protein
MSLWGPTIIAQLMRISVKQAAHLFVYVSAAGILGKILFSFAAPLFGRRRLGQIHGFGTFLALARRQDHRTVEPGVIAGTSNVLKPAATEAARPARGRCRNRRRGARARYVQPNLLNLTHATPRRLWAFMTARLRYRDLFRSIPVRRR